DLSYNPLTQVMLVLLNEPMNGLELEGVRSCSVELEADATQYDVMMHVWETPDGLAGFCHFSTDLFNATTIARMLGHFQVLLAGLVAEPEERVFDLPLLTSEERRQLLAVWNDTHTEYEPAENLHA